MRALALVGCLLLASGVEAQAAKPKRPATIPKLERWLAKQNADKPIDVAMVAGWIQELTPPAGTLTALDLRQRIVMLRDQLELLDRVQRLRLQLRYAKQNLAEARQAAA